MTVRYELGIARKWLTTNGLRISFAGQGVFSQSIYFSLNGQNKGFFPIRHLVFMGILIVLFESVQQKCLTGVVEEFARSLVTGPFLCLEPPGFLNLRSSLGSL